MSFKKQDTKFINSELGNTNFLRLTVIDGNYFTFVPCGFILM